MKKMKSTICVIILLSLSTVAFATDTLQVSLFPVSLKFNGQHKPLPSEYAILNYNGHAYVPVRFLVEQMGGTVLYEQQSQSIAMNYPSTQATISSISSIQRAGDFELALHSEKKTYKQTDVIRIWSSLTYLGEEETTITHGLPLLHFSIKDEEGFIREESQFDILHIHVMRKYNQYHYDFHNRHIRYFNFEKSQLKDVDLFLESTSNPDALRPGEYTFGVRAYFDIEESLDVPNMYTQLNITIDP